MSLYLILNGYLKKDEIVSLIDIILDTPPRQLYRSLYKRITKRERLIEFSDDKPCVFVMSTGRVGSMTLASLLERSDNLIALHEPKPSLYPISKAIYQQDTDINIWDQVFMSLRQSQFDNSLELGRGYVETSPQSTFLAPVIASAIPNVRFIHLVRNPADVIRSGMRRGWYDGHPADKNRIVPRADSDFYSRWLEMTSFQKNAWLWNETNRWILDFLISIPNDRQFTLYSEELYSGDISSLQSLFEFCSSSLPRSNDINKLLSRNMNKQKVGEFPEPDKWQANELEQLEFLTGDTARSLGYNHSKKI